jgi:hypothetical protein
MKKFLTFLLFAVFTAMISGCAGNLRFSSNIPSHGTFVTILNNTSYSLLVRRDGGLVEKKVKTEDGKEKWVPYLISPGGSIRTGKRSWSTQGSNMSIAVTACDRHGNPCDSHGNPYGSAQQNYSISGYYGNSQTWIVYNHHIRR